MFRQQRQRAFRQTDKGNPALTNPDHLERQRLAVEYDFFCRLGGRTDVLAS